MVREQATLKERVFQMTALTVDGVQYRSKCEYVRYLLEKSPETMLTDSDIARLAGVAPQTVRRQKEFLLGLR